MNFSVKGEYALQAIFDLAAHQGRSGSPNQPIKIADIARRQKIPQKFLELILAGLKQGGFVESRRGADGGYLLARPADSISVGEVLRFVEGSRHSQSAARNRGEGPFSDMWRKVDQSVSDVIDRTTFQEITRAWRDRQSKYVPNWDI